ncbi:MAG: starvation-inducible DNA-binding protein [Candidatus Midichloriaceae bacterium]|jgi:starvation-inducible DNA-binding protein
MTSDVFDSINGVLVNLYAVFLKTQNYHWNITGENFSSNHKLLDEQYNGYITLIDELAEHLRYHNFKVTLSFNNMKSMVFIGEINNDLGSKDMIKDLLKSIETLYQNIEKAFQLCQSESLESSSDIMLSLIKHLEQNIYHLRSSI